MFTIMLAPFIQRFGPFHSITLVINDADDNVGLAQGVDLLLNGPRTYVSVVDGTVNVSNLTTLDLVVCLSSCEVEEDSSWSWLVREGNPINYAKLRMDSNVYIYDSNNPEKTVHLREVYALKGGLKIFNNYLGKLSLETGGKSFMTQSIPKVLKYIYIYYWIFL